MTFEEYIALEQKHNAETVKTYEMTDELPFATAVEAAAVYETFCKREGYRFGSEMSTKAFKDSHRYFLAEYVIDIIKDCKRFIQFGRDVEFTKNELFDGLRRGGLKVRKIQLTADGTAYLTFFRKPKISTRIFDFFEWGVLDKGRADEEMASDVLEWIFELGDDPKRIAAEIWTAWRDKCKEENIDPNSGLSLYTDEE